MCKHFFSQTQNFINIHYFEDFLRTLCQFLNWILNLNDVNNVHRQKEVLLKSEKKIHRKKKRKKKNEVLLSTDYVFVIF